HAMKRNLVRLRKLRKAAIPPPMWDSCNKASLADTHDRISIAQTPRTVLQHLGFPGWTSWIAGMWLVSRNFSGQVQEYAGRMFVSRYGRAERHVAQMLQGVGESVIRRIA